MFKPQQCALLVSLACAGQAYAANVPEFAGDPVIVTATRQPQSIAKTLSDVSVITRQEIEESGVRDLVQLLARQPGIESASNGGAGTNASLFLRGANPKHTLVLIDGMRIVSASSGASALEHIPLAQIDRIEIVRGPASSLYGADAIGGVIQIFTRQGEGAPVWSLNFGGGDRGTFRSDASFTGKTGGTAYSFAVSREQTRGFSATNPKAGYYSYNPDRDGYENTAYNARVTQTLSPGHDLSLQLFQTFSETDYDETRDARDMLRARQTGASIETRNQLSSNWKSSLRFTRTEDKQENFTAGNMDTRSSLYATEQNEWQWQNTIDTALGGFVAGVVYTDQHVNGNAYYFPQGYSVTSRDNKAGFLSYQGEFGKHLLQASARRDVNSQFGGKNTGSIGYGFRLSEEWLVRVGYATAFKAPTFDDLYGSYKPNPLLKPEVSQNVEAAIKWRQGSSHAELTWYRNQIDSLIVYQNNLTGAQNKDARINGVTLSGGRSINSWDISGSATYQDPKDKQLDTQLIRRARAFAQLNASYDWGRALTGVEWKVSGRRPDTDFNTGKSIWLSGYSVTNLFADYRVNKNWTAVARLDNVFDKEYETAFGYNTGGLGWYLGVRYVSK
ncbi:TonB-dependent receptor [Chromobacterium alkanivorans]|uniref:TonB-dependent receptor domain-containing protein n=1 Tax=Chromobacterium alkanivorans TaxID=1071719 RepID=UPI00196827A2|nr:TonB-dependent receptor [Chromobacterium alkanivorans]MBN3004069.1 TonB-dependent receptor [Chromobacterium alkanivorans]